MNRQNLWFLIILYMVFAVPERVDGRGWKFISIVNELTISDGKFVSFVI